jgi:putative hemolysin
VEPYPRLASALPAGDVREGAYRVRFAQTLDELDTLLRLRFAVFNLELGEGLAASFATGRDEDEFDCTCHHLLVEHLESGRIIGTYRLQTREMARAGSGFYTATEYDLSLLPEEILERGVEVGRACIAREHRKRPVLYLLWKGLALYMAHNRLRWLFGCCSLTTQDPADGHRALAHLRERGVIHPSLWVPALAEYDCGAPAGAVSGTGVKLPELFEIYLRYGSRIIGPPALDRRFKTIDFLVLLDVAGLSPRAHRMFFP